MCTRADSNDLLSGHQPRHGVGLHVGERHRHNKVQEPRAVTRQARRCDATVRRRNLMRRYAANVWIRATHVHGDTMLTRHGELELIAARRADVGGSHAERGDQ